MNEPHAAIPNDGKELEDAKVEQTQKADKTRDQHIDQERPTTAQKHPDAYMNGAGDVSLNSPTSIMMLVQWRPAVGSFQFLADCTYPASLPPHERFCRLRDLHPNYYWVVIVIDLIVLLAVLAGLGTIAARVIWITLFV